MINLRESSLTDMERCAILHRHLMDTSFPFIEKFKAGSDTALTFRSHAVLMPDTSTEILRKLSVSSQPARQRFTGNVFIITDGWCTGARGFFCSKVKGRPQTFFSGEPWGACTFGMNWNPLVLKLPHTGITVRIPTRQLLAQEAEYSDVSRTEVDFPLGRYPVDEWLERSVEEIKKR